MTQPFIGQLMYVSFNFAPKGWAMANGQFLSIQQNAALFSVLGTTYGGNGTTNFQLPDMRSRAPVHQGQGLGLSTYVIGEQTGTENRQISGSNLPSHTHSMVVSATNATTQEPAAGVFVGSAVSDGGSMKPQIYVPRTGAALVNMSNQAIGNAGAGQQFSIIKPYLTLTCNISLIGIFPTRN